jgi:hypothetical protein
MRLQGREAAYSVFGNLSLVSGAFVGGLLVVTCKQNVITLILDAAANAREKIRLLGVWDAVDACLSPRADAWSART